MEITIINQDKIILLILKIFSKIVTTAKMIIKNLQRITSKIKLWISSSERIIIEIVLMNDNAIIPTRVSKESAGLDLYSSIDVDIEVGSIKKVNTGICISLCLSL